MAYALDGELTSLFSMIPEGTTLDYRTARQGAAEMVSLLPQYDPPHPLDIRDVMVPGPDGAPEVPVRLYVPSAADSPLPALVYIHGGGFFMGSRDMDDGHASRIAAEVGAVVVSVEYRLAPEHPFPAGLEDCYAALAWVAKSASELGIDPDRLAVGGESAGGGLAAACALLARDRGGPALCFQYLEYPEIDDRLATASMLAYEDTPLWNKPAAEISWDYYLGAGKRGTADVSPYAAPARAEDLSGLPPAFVSACQFDPLRDEDIAYAQRLAQANVPTELVLYPGTVHGSKLVREAAISRRMNADVIAALRRGLHSRG
ncbi:alpha/beta hydrolase [Amycolatopsis jejuensis]|uniref:alpha/beta hydrolase n=1 Tax=Amycolatopsis jejuensis TaxID=330084 RepID=UPI00052455EC|nr:alpha/beta hydrolase [Amycolatopsis jejuensis]